MTKNERVKKVIFWLISQGVANTQEEIAAKIGNNVSYLSQVVSGKKPVSGKFINNFCLVFDKVNPNYLSMTEPNMLKEEAAAAKKQQFATYLSDKFIMNVPLVSKFAYAGYLSGYGDDEYIESLPTVPFVVDHEARGNYICFEVKGDSMDDGTTDGYVEGEVLLCREINQMYWAESGLHIKKWDFVIAHREEGIVVKRIVQHDVEAGTIVIRSLNDMYPDRTLYLKDVHKIFNVVSSQKPRKR